MSTVGPVYPAQFVVGQAAVKLVADETDNADAGTIKSDQQRLSAAQEIEAVEAATSAVDVVA
jgi:hypothetical protein